MGAEEVSVTLDPETRLALRQLHVRMALAGLGLIHITELQVDAVNGEVDVSLEADGPNYRRLIDALWAVTPLVPGLMADTARIQTEVDAGGNGYIGHEQFNWRSAIVEGVVETTDRGVLIRTRARKAQSQQGGGPLASN